MFFLILKISSNFLQSRKVFVNFSEGKQLRVTTAVITVWRWSVVVFMILWAKEENLFKCIGKFKIWPQVAIFIYNLSVEEPADHQVFIYTYTHRNIHPQKKKTVRHIMFCIVNVILVQQDDGQSALVEYSARKMEIKKEEKGFYSNWRKDKTAEKDEEVEQAKKKWVKVDVREERRERKLTEGESAGERLSRWRWGTVLFFPFVKLPRGFPFISHPLSLFSASNRDSQVMFLPPNSLQVIWHLF